MEISYDYYRIFYYVVKYGSFSKAATALYRGQPNLTKTINNLEKQLNCKLFVRSNRGVTLTPEGEKLYKHVEIAFLHLDGAEKELQRHSSLEEGTVHIATTEIALHGGVLPAIIAFQEEYPRVKIRLKNYTNPDAVLALKNGLYDFAVTTGEVQDSQLRVTKLQTFREILCKKKGSFPCAPYDSLQKILEYPFICLNMKTDFYKGIREYFLRQKILREPDIEVSIIEQAILLIRKGVGIGFIPDILAAELIASGEIEEIPLPIPLPTRTICLLQNKREKLNFAAHTFIEYLQ